MLKVKFNDGLKYISTLDWLTVDLYISLIAETVYTPSIYLPTIVGRVEISILVGRYLYYVRRLHGIASTRISIYHR